MNETKRADWSDIFCSAFYEVDGQYRVNFRIHSWDGAEVGGDENFTPIYEGLKPLVEGFVKWDGCNEWDTADGAMHFCSRDGARALADAIERCFDIAAGILSVENRGAP